MKTTPEILEKLKAPETFFHAHYYGARVDEVKGLLNLSEQYVAVLRSGSGQNTSTRREKRVTDRDGYFATKVEALEWLVALYTVRVNHDRKVLEASLAELKLTTERLEQEK